MLRGLTSFSGLLSLCVATLAAEPEVDSSQLPRVLPTPPEKALATFKVKPGFRIELVAAEPLVVSPVAISFDEDGRLYVIEMRDYSERRPERLGRVRLLEDTDGDGRFEKSTVFADGLPWPTAVTCWAGGVFVGATPDILWMKDTTGDGVADEREVIFTGFASDYAPFATNKLNVQALMNSFQWTLDNRIHGATSFSGGKVKLVDSPFTREWRRRGGARSASDPGSSRREEAQTSREGDQSLLTSAATANRVLDLRGRDFSFDPRTLEMRAESGGGQHGMTFDNRGRKFVCSNSDHIQQIVYEERYAARNPYYTMPSPRVSIAVDGPAAEVFRISPDEPWRVIRTQWRVAGKVSGPIEGGGRASGYFTGATGVTIYRGDAYGEEFVGDAFIGDAGGNLVHRKKLRPDGILMRAERPAGEQKVEFLASTDNWFRPVQFANAPDGCLYIADMYREVIEHPWSLPPNLKKHLDLNSGNDRGRIYRIVHEEFQRRPAPGLSKASGKTLGALLSHQNGWHRDAAARLLYERQDAKAIAGLEAQVFSRTQSPLDSNRDAFAMLHSLYALDGLGVLKEEHVLAALASRHDFGVRDNAMKLAQPFLEKPSEALLRRLKSLGSLVTAFGPEPGPDLQLVLTLGQIRGPEKAALLSELLSNRIRRLRATPQGFRTSTNEVQWLISAAVSSLGSDAVQFFRRLGFEEGELLLPNIGQLVGARNQPQEIADLLSLARKELGLPQNAVALYALEAGLRQSGNSLRRNEFQAELKELFELGARLAASSNENFTIRRAAIKLLGLADYDMVRSNLLAIVSSGIEWKDYRQEALFSLAHSGHGDFGPDLVSHWSQLTPALRSHGLELLLKRPQYTRVLFAAIEKGTVRVTDLSIAQQAQLRSHRDPSIREQALKILGREPAPARQSVVDKFQSSLAMKGEMANGRKLFQARCASCHKLGSEGHGPGPDLATVKSGGKEKLLIAILDPNREVAPNFASYAVETKDGESLTGVLASESAASVTLRMAGGAESVIVRANIASMQSRGRSLMPEGLDEGLKPQDMADLLEFVLSTP